MKKIQLLIFTLLLAAILAACGGGGPTATLKPVETEPAPTEEVVAMPEMVPVEQIQSITWQWTALVETEPASQSVVPDAENYTVTFFPDNFLSVKADCNQVLGEYSVDGDQMSLQLGPSTLAFCGDESSDQQFLGLLSQVASFGMEGEQLLLNLQDGAGKMIFQNGGAAQQPEPTPEFCAGVQINTVSIDTMGLPQSWKANCVDATPYDTSTPPGPVGLPEHAQINFGVEDPADVQPGDPIVYILPADAYAELWGVNGNEAVSTSMELLRGLLNSRPATLPTAGMPALPYERVTGYNDLAVQGAYVDTELFSGVRYVGRFVQSPNPVSNEGLYYIFQGFTKDGQYLISFFYPVTSAKLPATAGEVSSEEMGQVDADSTAYMAGKTAELNALAPSDWTPDLSELDSVIESLQFDWVPTGSGGETSFMDSVWEWYGLIETQPASQSLIPNSEDYTLLFNQDGTFSFRADCNSGSGIYTQDGANLTMEVQILTRALCSPESSSDQFIGLLGQVANYQVDQNGLQLGLANDAGRMLFNSQGPAVSVNAPAEGTPSATAIEAVNVRSGPGTQYPSYGVAPAGTTGEVIGVSEDRAWWVVRLSSNITPEEQGWVSVYYVTASNTEGVPVVPAPDLPEIEIPEPPPGTPIATAVDAANVRSGPSIDYPSYGVSAREQSAPAIGMSEDGRWVVVQLPTTIAPDGMGWIVAYAVRIYPEGTSLPVIPAPPLP